ncbi:MAG: hypothetical protein A2Y73_04115 [Chloroflexi bacterium RBG_13_56_8]|nr:MAG: hypothetical protein A2Y73_04115 [Chloroflexi bacterium RBG_13_56_8]
MPEQRMYSAPDVDLANLAEALNQWFQGQGYEAQVLAAPGEGYVVQARRPESWRSWVGMSAALNVTLTPQGENLMVQTGAAKWADKAVVGAVGVLILWPMIIPAAYGAWKQKQLPDEVFRFIDQYVVSGGKVPTMSIAGAPVAAAPASSPRVRCPSCGEPVREGAKFCDNCGASLTLACANCGAALRLDAKFCDNCGAPVGAAS